MPEEDDSFEAEYMAEESVSLRGLDFMMTSIGCPEQYDIIHPECGYLGYARIRFGHLTARNADGEIVFEHRFGNRWKGVFNDDDERDKWLSEIAEVFGY